MEIHVFGEPAVGPAGVVSIFGFSQPLWVVSTVLHGSPNKNYQAITFMLKFLHVEICCLDVLDVDFQRKKHIQLYTLW